MKLCESCGEVRKKVKNGICLKCRRKQEAQAKPDQDEHAEEQPMTVPEEYVEEQPVEEEPPESPAPRNELPVIKHSQPESCPYTRERSITLLMNSREYAIPASYLENFGLLSHKNIKLGYDDEGRSDTPPRINTAVIEGISADINHTLVHFLYTGEYQTLRSQAMDSKSFLYTEYQRSVLAYHAARKYGLEALQIHAQGYIEEYSQSMSIFNVLRTAGLIFSELPQDEEWFHRYIQRELDQAFKSDGTIFKSSEFYDALARDLDFREAIMKMMVDILLAKIQACSRDEEGEVLLDQRSPVHSLDTPLQDDEPSPTNPRVNDIDSEPEPIRTPESDHSEVPPDPIHDEPVSANPAPNWFWSTTSTTQDT